jgi:hypothetical protein
MTRAIVTGGLALVAIPALFAATAGAAKGPFAPEDCSKPKVEPQRIVISCADDGIFVDSITWNSWKKRKATGEGTLNVNTCNPNCAEGNFKTYPVDMTLNKVRERKCGKKKVPLFLKLLLSFPQNAPSSADELGKNTMSCGG